MNVTLLGRRQFLTAAGALGVGSLAGLSLAGCSGRQAPPQATPSVLATTSPTPSRTASTTVARWPGHVPGCVVLGASAGRDIEATAALAGPLGTARRFYSWDDTERETQDIASDHAAGRLPWVSFKPANRGPGGWAEIISGMHDAEIRQRALRYAGLTKPVVLTFHHEPNNDAEGTPEEFAQAWRHIYDVMHSATGMANCAYAPIVGESMFDTKGRSDPPEAFLTPSVLEMSSFLGIDLYQNRSGASGADRLERVLGWLEWQGYADLMIGLGEVGATDFWGRPTGASWWSSLWAWALANTDRIGIISYFNSVANNHAEADWRLSESATKLGAFRRSITQARTCAES